jgi:hypothetical protein
MTPIIAKEKKKQGHPPKTLGGGINAKITCEQKNQQK